MSNQAIELGAKIAQRFSRLPEVEAVALAGSHMAGNAGQASDIDIFVYPHVDITPQDRLSIAAEFSDDPETNDFWGPGNEWIDRATQLHVDCVFFTVSFIENQLERVLSRYEATLGYSTAFWHTVCVSHILYDPHGWFDTLQQRARQSYPEPLIKAIVAKNYPVLGQIRSSYRRQLQKAALRGDTVSLNHRMAAFLASYFDIIFAVNRLAHPGEKRQLDFAEKHCAVLPENLRDNVNQALQTSAPTPSINLSVVQAVDTLIETLDEVLIREKLLNGIAP